MTGDCIRNGGNEKQWDLGKGLKAELIGHADGTLAEGKSRLIEGRLQGLGQDELVK